MTTISAPMARFTAPPNQVFPISDVEVATRTHEQLERERPADRDGERGGTDPAQPGRDGDRTDQRRINRVSAHQQQGERDDERTDRQQKREPVALSCRAAVPLRELSQPVLAHRPT